MLQRKLYTLVLIRNENQILLGLKKRGFGENKWGGFGGKVEANETIIEAAVRELKEESCLDVNPNDLKNIAHLEFTFEGEQLLMDVRVFSTNIYKGTPQETEEMLPKWFTTDNIPFDYMWPGDKLWYPYMFQNKPIAAHFHFKDHVTVLRYNIEELTSMEAFYATQTLL